MSSGCLPFSYKFHLIELGYSQKDCGWQSSNNYTDWSRSSTPMENIWVKRHKRTLDWSRNGGGLMYI